MRGEYKIKGLQTFTIGLILLAATGFTSLLNLSGVMSAVYVALNAAALFIMAVGMASVRFYAGGFKRAFAVLVADAVITTCIVIIVLIDKSGAGILAKANFVMTLAAKALDILGVVFVIYGCRELLHKVNDQSKAAKCKTLAVIYVIAMIMILAIYGAVTVVFPGNRAAAIYGVGALAVAVAVLDMAVVARVYKTIKTWKAEAKKEA